MYFFLILISFVYSLDSNLLLLNGTIIVEGNGEKYVIPDTFQL